jgi:hypothetical protein
MHHGMRLLVLAGLTVLLGGCEDPALAPDNDRAPLGARGSAGPTTPSNLTSTAGSPGQIDVAWKDNSGNEAGFEVHGSATGPNGTFSLWTTTEPNITQTSFTGLGPSESYCHKVRAFTNGSRKPNYSQFSNTACTTTLPPPPPPPKAPSGTAAKPLNSTTVAVTWADNSDDEDGFRVERSLVSCVGTWEPAGTTGPNTTSFTDGGRVAEQVLCYRVRAFKASSLSGPSLETVTIPPAAATQLTATMVVNAASDLAWTDNSQVEDGYEVRRAAAQGGPYSKVGFVGLNTTSYRDNNLTSGTTYWYRVLTSKNWGFSDPSHEAATTAEPTAPNAPLATNVIPRSSTVALILWEDKSGNEDGFRIERSSDGGSTWTTAGSTGVNGVSFDDQEQTSEQQICYRLISFNTVGSSPASNTDCTALPAGPTAPVLTVLENGEGADFRWTDNSGVEDGYEIIESTTEGYFTTAWLPPNSTSFRYPYYNSGFAYFVAAVKDGGYSDLAAF